MVQLYVAQARSIMHMLLILMLASAVGVRAEQAADNQHPVYLPLATSTGVPQPPVPPTLPAGASTADLIAAALASGEINAETALAYRVFAAFADPALPARFRGTATPNTADDSVLGELAARFSQLSPQTQATLQPFTIPPYHAGSWWDLRQPATAAQRATPRTIRGCDTLGDNDLPLTNWRSVDSPGGNVRVWWQTDYPEDEAKAIAYAATVDDIWDILATILRREPPNDGGNVRPCRGDDNRLDISLVTLGEDIGGVTKAYDNPEDGPTPSYVLLDRDSPVSASGRAFLIHELMHVFQSAFSVTSFYEYRWWREATADWAIHAVERLDSVPDSNYEHNHAPNLLGVPQLSLETWTTGGHQYGAYLFPFFIELGNGMRGDMVRQSLERGARMSNSLENINGLIAGGFANQWAEFTLENLNRAPADVYTKIDGVPWLGAITAEHVPQLSGDRYRRYVMDGKVSHLASHTFRFRFNDPSIRAVAFENPYVRDDFPTARVRALYRIQDGAWVSEDWTGREWRPFCRDLKSERVSELFVVISNSEWRDRNHVLQPATPPQLHTSNMACGGWEVESTVVATEEGPSTFVQETVSAQAMLKLKQDTDARWTSETYQATAGKATWSHAGNEGSCAGSANGTYSLADTDDGAYITRLLVDVYGIGYDVGYHYDGSRRYVGVGSNHELNKTFITYTCANSQPYEKAMLHIAWFHTDPVTSNLQVSNDGQTMSGTYTHSATDSGGYTVKSVYSWKIKALPPE